MESKALDQHLKNTLDEVSRKGIRVQRDQLKKNICSQFPDYRLWIREYITNALAVNSTN